MTELYADLRALVLVLIGFGIILHVHNTSVEQCVQSGGSPSNTVFVRCE
jgi:hypothetical protein